MYDLSQLDETHDPARRSFVEAANAPDSDFPIQNLPFGIFSTDADPTLRIGVAIGDHVLDLKKIGRLGLLPQHLPSEVYDLPSLNALFALGRGAIRDVRRSVAGLLDQRASGNAARGQRSEVLVPLAECTLHRPTAVSNYTDFYAGIHHARAAGALLTPENPLPQNYKWIPIAYHGRASSVQVGGGTVRRPLGQLPPAEPGASPKFGPCDRLDFELEMGF
jgi:fumarylacetoacetase